jgi:hypothetical protein
MVLRSRFWAALSLGLGLSLGSEKFIPVLLSGFWTAYCACCVILAIDRLIDLCSPKWARFLFEGRRTWFWMIIPVLYGSFFASPLSLPLIYNLRLIYIYAERRLVVHYRPGWTTSKLQSFNSVPGGRGYPSK